MTTSDSSPGGGARAGVAEGSGWPRWFWPCFVVGLLACALPMVVAPILPMSDLNGQAGIVGALLQRSHPDSRVGAYFAFNVHASPNAFYWAVTYVLGKLMPLRAANNLFVAVFCVAGLPLAYLFTLRTLDRPPALAFFALAAVYHRCLWYGFVDSVAAVGFLFLEIGLLNRAFTRRAWSWWDGALALTMLVLATAHAFIFLVGAGLWLLFAVLAWRQPSPLYRRLLVALPALAYLGPWLVPFFRGHGGRGSGHVMAQLWHHRDPLRVYLLNMHEWFLNGYTSSVDEAVAVVFAVTLLAALVVGVRMPAPPATPAELPAPDRLWASRLPIAAGLLGVGYFLLPLSITQPVGWWAVNVRLLVPFILMLGLLVPPRRRGLPSWALAPLWAAATLYGLYIAQDFRRWWVGVELRGFDAALQAIPVGQTVHAIYPSFGGEHHYRHFPMGHIVDWYVAERGGLATPWMTSHPHEVWASPRWRPAGYWGLQDHFVWQRYGPSWDYFLVKQPAPGNGGAYVPFRDAPEGAVTRVFDSGLWSVWKRTQ